MKKLSVLFLISLLAFQLGCTPTEESKRIEIGTDYKVVENLSQMAQDAEIIVIGTFQKYNHSYNAERNPKNEFEESTEAYSETKVYDFAIEETIKGDESETSIQVSIPYTKEFTSVRDEKGAQLRFRVPSPVHVQPTIGKKYVLFLMKNEITDTYSAPFLPYMIEIKSDNKVALQKPKEEIATTLRANNNNLYKIFVEGVHIKKDEISGKSLDQLKKELAKVLGSESEDSHSSDEENNIENENPIENEALEKLEDPEATEQNTNNEKLENNEQQEPLQDQQENENVQ